MRKIQSLLLMALMIHTICLNTFADNITKRYKTHLTERGMLYFIMPQSMPKANDSHARKALFYDITSLATSDTVTVTATIEANGPVRDSVAVITMENGERISVKLEYIYTDLTNNSYISRVKFHMDKAVFRKMFTSSVPFLLDYGQGNRFAFPKGKWEKERGTVCAILDLMELNR